MMKPEDTPLQEGRRIAQIRRPRHECIERRLDHCSFTCRPILTLGHRTSPHCHIQRMQTDAVEVVRREPYEYDFTATRHLLILCEHSERDDGETFVEGLPKSTLRRLSGKLSFVPAGHRFSGWQKPRNLTRVTYFYIDPHGPLIDPSCVSPKRNSSHGSSFRQGFVETAIKLKAQAEQPGSDKSNT